MWKTWEDLKEDHFGIPKELRSNQEPGSLT